MVADFLITVWQLATIACWLGPVGFFLEREHNADKARWLASNRQAPFGLQTTGRKARRWAIALTIFVVSSVIAGTMHNATEGVYRALVKAAPF